MQVGTLNESSLHASLKDWYARPGDLREQQVEGYLVDLVRGDLLVEIQTGSFAKARRKLYDLGRRHAVRLVYPVAEKRTILRIATIGDKMARKRTSPKRGRLEELFKELIFLPEWLLLPNASLEVLLVEDEMVWVNDGKGSWRRKGWSVVDRRLIAVNNSRVFASAADLLELLPDGLGQAFTTAELAESARIRPGLAGKMAYCLRKIGLLQVTAKRGKAFVYEVTGAGCFPAPEDASG